MLRKAESVEGLLAKHPLAASPSLQQQLDTLLQKQVGVIKDRLYGCWFMWGRAWLVAAGTAGTASLLHHPSAASP